LRTLVAAQTGIAKKWPNIRLAAMIFSRGRAEIRPLFGCWWILLRGSVIVGRLAVPNVEFR
jgi:hypothetical protein